MNEKTKIATAQIAKFLRDLMDEKGITAQDIINTGEINKQQLYSVLRIGKVFRPNYSIDTFIRALSLLNIHVEFSSLDDKSNFDLLPDHLRPGVN